MIKTTYYAANPTIILPSKLLITQLVKILLMNKIIHQFTCFRKASYTRLTTR